MDTVIKQTRPTNAAVVLAFRSAVLDPLHVGDIEGALGTIRQHDLAPEATGGSNFDAVALLLIISIVGTTVAPWQLFFQQSNVLDKRITPRWINYERWDTVIGSVLTNSVLVIVAAAIVLIPNAPLGLITESVQALAGLLLPSATIFLLLLCNDRDISPWPPPRV